MGRIGARFAKRRAEGRTAFVAFLTAGDPSLEGTVETALALEAAGTDVAADLRRLAALPNVWCKVSRLATEADQERWTPDDLRPYVDRVFECFGFDQTVFAGDWPVSSLAAHYPVCVETLETATLVRAWVDRPLPLPPGTVAPVKVQLRTHRGRTVIETLRVEVPASAPAGSYTLLVADATTMDAFEQRETRQGFAARDVDHLLRTLNRLRAGNRRSISGNMEIPPGGENGLNLVGSIPDYHQED